MEDEKFNNSIKKELTPVSRGKKYSPDGCGIISKNANFCPYCRKKLGTEKAIERCECPSSIQKNKRLAGNIYCEKDGGVLSK